MSNIYLSYNNIISALGFNSKEVVSAVSKSQTGLSLIDNLEIFDTPFYSSIVDSERLKETFSKIALPESYMRLEQMMLLSLKDVIDNSGIELNNRVGLLISTTKGNIDALDKNNPFPESKAYLNELAETIARFFNFKNDPIVVSNACISGVLAVSIAKRFIKQKKYDHVFIVSGDIVSAFIISGFNSFQAISNNLCKPYSKNRDGINIGEAAASILVTNDASLLAKESVKVLGDGSRNDANHISGPSRTGEGLYKSIDSALNEANIEAETIDYISAHGTATLYNDEMEAVALNRLNLGNVPMNSLKGYFGHTLGASGLVETIIGMHSLNKNMLYPSLGFDELGVTQKINVIKTTTPKTLHVFLKTASGFGGCNAAIILKKIN